MISIYEPLVNSLLLGSFTILFGHLLDINVSKNTLKDHYLNKDKIDLYIQGQKNVHFNLLIVSPINYIFSYNYLINNTINNLDLVKLLGLLI